MRSARAAQLLALAHQLAVRAHELVVELEHLLDQALLLADRRLGDHQHRSPARRSHTWRSLAGARRRPGAAERRATSTPPRLREPPLERRALRLDDQLGERRARQRAPREPLQRGVGARDRAVGRELGRERRMAVPGVLLQRLRGSCEALAQHRARRPPASAAKRVGARGQRPLGRAAERLPADEHERRRVERTQRGDHLAHARDRAPAAPPTARRPSRPAGEASAARSSAA